MRMLLGFQTFLMLCWKIGKLKFCDVVLKVQNFFFFIFIFFNLN